MSDITSFIKIVGIRGTFLYAALILVLIVPGIAILYVFDRELLLKLDGFKLVLLSLCFSSIQIITNVLLISPSIEKAFKSSSKKEDELILQGIDIARDAAQDLILESKDIIDNSDDIQKVKNAKSKLRRATNIFEHIKDYQKTFDVLNSERERQIEEWRCSISIIICIFSLLFTAGIVFLLYIMNMGLTAFIKKNIPQPIECKIFFIILMMLWFFFNTFLCSKYKKLLNMKNNDTTEQLQETVSKPIENSQALIEPQASEQTANALDTPL